MHIPVSVIIPMYNKEKYIVQTLTSILAQSNIPAEIIVVDDQSTDKSVDLVKEMLLQHREIRLVVQEKNGGVSRARNRGLQEAQCEYVTYIDADDFYYNSDKLKNEFLLLKEKEKEGLSACIYSKVIRVDATGKELKSREPKNCEYLQGDILTSLLEWVNFATVPRDYLIKKTILESVGGYDEKRSQFEDLDLVYKIAMKVPFFCTYEYGTAYRITENGLSAGNNGELKKNREEVINNNLSYLDCKTREQIIKRRRMRKKLYGIKSALYNFIRSRND